eukprot:gene12968-biopygen9132
MKEVRGLTTRPRHPDAGHEPARQRGGALGPRGEGKNQYCSMGGYEEKVQRPMKICNDPACGDGDGVAGTPILSNEYASPVLDCTARARVWSPRLSRRGTARVTVAGLS